MGLGYTCGPSSVRNDGWMCEKHFRQWQIAGADAAATMRERYTQGSTECPDCFTLWAARQLSNQPQTGARVYITAQATEPILANELVHLTYQGSKFPEARPTRRGDETYGVSMAAASPGDYVQVQIRGSASISSTTISRWTGGR